MKWLLIAVAILVGVPLLATLIGAMLPKSHTASRARRFRASPSQVWALLADYAAWPSWQDGVTVEKQPERDGKPAWLVTGKWGHIPFVIEQLSPPEAGKPGRMVSRIADDKLAFGGTWTYD